VSTISQAIPKPLQHKLPGGTSLNFRRIGLDVWSEFCTHIMEKRTAQIHDMKLGDEAKTSLIKDLVGTSIGMDDMLEQASTIDGMSWIVARCCLDKVEDSELLQVIPLAEVPDLFGKLADLENLTDDEEIEGAESGNSTVAESKTGA